MDKALSIHLAGHDEKDIRDSVGKIKVFLGEDGKTAIARVPGWKQPYVELERKRGRWFMACLPPRSARLPESTRLPTKLCLNLSRKQWAR